jgi:hypothetical protein
MRALKEKKESTTSEGLATIRSLFNKMQDVDPAVLAMRTVDDLDDTDYMADWLKTMSLPKKKKEREDEDETKA